MKHLYIFQAKDKDGKILSRYSQKCVQPKRTKIYKDILNRLNINNNLTESIEYYIELPF